MAASMDVNLQMEQMMTLARPSRKAKEDANNKIIITDNNNFQHNPNNSTHLQSLQRNHYGTLYHDNNDEMIQMNLEDTYGHYDNRVNPNQVLGYNPPTLDLRAKPFDIASINHLDQIIGKHCDDNIGNMGPPAAKKKRGRLAATVNNVSNGPESENSLYGAIRFGKVPIQTLVDDWIEQYNVTREQAMLGLMQFFVSCCGCKGKISTDIFTQISQATVIRKLTEEFDEENGEYPLIQNNAKRFKSNFIDFIQVLIRQCQYSIIYDQYLIDQITSLLTVLTDSQVRAFRHTGTIAAMKMMTALVDVTLNISINRENNQRQLEAERNKIQQSRSKSGGGMTERLQTLTKRQHELEENMNEVKNMLTFLVKGVFVHRYRDSQPEIRCICMEEIGIWMQRYPIIFLDDSYLKYVGWTLYDRVGIVRAQCLKTLQPLYEERNLVTNLELFTSRFKSRLVDMTLDKDVEVAVQAVKVVSCIFKYNESILEDRDCENIYELVYCTNKNLAQAAGEFLNQKLFQIDVNTPITKSRKGKKRSENTPLVRDLVQFFIESELHEHAGYLVDSLWEVSSMVKDWECMIDMLLEDPGKGEQSMTSAQETSLIEILYWCVKQASTGESPVGRQPVHHHQSMIQNTPGSNMKTGRSLSNKEVKAIAEDRNKLTEVLIPALPALLAKYGEDVIKINNIVQLPLFMNLELYTSGRYERYLDLLIKYLQEMVERHTDQEILVFISQVFQLLCADDLSISTKCQTARGTLLDRLIDSYKRSYSRYYSLSQADEPTQDDAYMLHASIKRLGAFYTCHNLKTLDLWDSLVRICQSAHNQAVYHEEIVANTISTCYVALLWQLNIEDNHTIADVDMINIRNNLLSFLVICRSYLDHQSNLIAQESYKSICDLLIVCSKHLLIDCPDLEPLVYQPDFDLQNALIHYLEQRVFVEDDTDEDENVKIEELHNRRTNLGMFFKLIIYNILPIRAASSIYKFYLRFFNDFGDIMKSALAKSREINRVHTAKMVMECLTAVHRELLVEHSGVIDRSLEGFQALKELSRRLNLSFGLDLIKIREAMMELHKMAIDTVLSDMPSQQSFRPPSNLLVLELAAEFSNKLLGPDKKLLLDNVNKTFPHVSSGDMAEDWVSLCNYKVSLDPDSMENISAHGESCHSGTGSAHNITSAPMTITRPRGRPKKPKDQNSSISHNAAPPNHSTAIKKKRFSHSFNSVSAALTATPHPFHVSSIYASNATEESPIQNIQNVSSRGRILKNRITLSMVDHLSNNQ